MSDITVDGAVVKEIGRAHGFAHVRSEELVEIDGTAHVMVHEASGARLLYLRNDDPNKAFSIAFKTPAADDTGVFHILEHSVLCGSARFPVKEPFVNLLKSSMQTFLNAMTFPDKTMYPVASTNERDLLNLATVYLDAVFQPAIYDKRTIFQQEGWHVEVASADPLALTYNGVVYNEMKGALSDPDSVLYDAVSAALFPDTTYRFESGGTPEAIPTLTYEGFLDAHRRHYRPDNAYIVLYGDLDLDAFLALLDEDYLTPLSRVDRPPLEVNPLSVQTAVVAEGRTVEMVTASENASCALGYVIGEARERERIVAADILLDAIMGSNEAPLKRALLDAGLAADAVGYLADAIYQPFAIIQLKGIDPAAQEAHESVSERFRAVVEETLERLADGGLDRALVAAALSHAEFVMREHDFGYPDGVADAISAMAGWLYDDDLAYAYLRYEDVFASLRAKIEEGYFERLIRELFLDSRHHAQVELVPVTSVAPSPAEERLVRMAEDLDSEGVREIEEDVERLRAAQEAPDAPADLAKLPGLRVSDIEEAPTEHAPVLHEEGPLRYLRHDIPTHGILYATRYFDLSVLSFEELPYAAVLALVLGRLGTEAHSAAELDTLVQTHLGTLGFFCEVHERVASGADEAAAAQAVDAAAVTGVVSGDEAADVADAADASGIAVKFVAMSSALSHEADAAAQLADEVLYTTDLSDTAKILDILTQRKIAMEQGFASAGNAFALSRVASYCSEAGLIRERFGGFDLYFFLCDLIDGFEERAEDLVRKLADISSRIFVERRCIVSFTGDDEAFLRYRRAHEGVLSSRGDRDDRTGSEGDGAHGGEAEAAASGGLSLLRVPVPSDKHEAFVVPSDVTFTAMGYDRRLLDDVSPYSGAWVLAARVLSYDYLWNEVRVKGGAYGAGFQAVRTGSSRFYSYRDPHVDATVERFAEAGAWLSSFSPDDTEMEGYIVSTTASMDSPLKARALARRQTGMYFSGLTLEDRTRTRSEIVSATSAQLCVLGDDVSRIAQARVMCTVGARELVEASDLGFNIVDVLGTRASAR